VNVWIHHPGAVSAKERELLKMLEQERDRTEHTREALQRDNDNLKAAYTQVPLCVIHIVCP